MFEEATAEEHEVLAKSCREIKRHTDATRAQPIELPQMMHNESYNQNYRTLQIMRWLDCVTMADGKLSRKTTDPEYTA